VSATRISIGSQILMAFKIYSIPLSLWFVLFKIGEEMERYRARK